MSKKYFVFSDVHSYYDELIIALNEQGFDKENPNHYIISLGDACDRGTKPKEVLQFLLDMYDKGRAVLILGNHEDLMEECICRRYFQSHDMHNRTYETVQYLTDMDIGDYSDYEVLDAMADNELWQKYINSCVNYAEIGDNIFVHGWIPIVYKEIEDETYKDIPILYRPTEQVYNPDWRNAVWGDDWGEARWYNGMKMWQKGIREPNKTIWCGHYHTSWGHAYLHDDGKEWLEQVETYYIDPDTGKQEPHVNHDPFIDDGIVAMDACTAISGVVNCKILEVEDENTN